MDDNGVTPAGSGHEVSPSAADASSQSRVPNAELRDGLNEIGLRTDYIGHICREAARRLFDDGGQGFYHLNFMDGSEITLRADSCEILGKFHTFYFINSFEIVAPATPPGLMGRLFGSGGTPERRRRVTERKWILSIRSAQIHSIGPASGIEARSDETPAAAQPEGQEPGPQGDAHE